MKYFNFFVKGFFFVNRYIWFDPVFVMQYACVFWRKIYDVGVQFYTQEEIVAQIKNGKSYIRLGDGEIGMMHGRDIHYQKYEKDLDNSFKKMIKDYRQESAYTLAIPVFAGFSNDELKKTKGKLQCWLPLKIEFQRIFRADMKYADAHLFYYKNFVEKYLESYFKTKKIIIHTEKRNIIEQKENIENVFTVLGWVECLPYNSYDGYKANTQSIQCIIDEYIKRGGRAEDILLLSSAGPLSKKICYEMSRTLQCIDIGRGFEHIYNDKNYQSAI